MEGWCGGSEGGWCKCREGGCCEGRLSICEGREEEGRIKLRV